MEKYRRERDRMLDAREYLAEKGKLEDESTEDVLYEKYGIDTNY